MVSTTSPVFKIHLNQILIIKQFRMSTTKSIIEKNPALADISLEELEELMKERQQALSERQREKRQAYETKKDALINELGQFAQNVFGMMADLKYEASGN